MKPAKRKILLEIGPGWAPAALKHKAHERLLLEIKSSDIRRLRQVHGDKAGYIRGDAQRLPVKSNAVSRIETRMVDRYFLENKKELQRVADEIRRVLKTGGTATLSAESPFDLVLTEVFERAGFRLVKGQELSKHPQFGKISTEFEHGLSLSRPVYLLKFKKVR